MHVKDRGFENVVEMEAQLKLYLFLFHHLCSEYWVFSEYVPYFFRCDLFYDVVLDTNCIASYAE